MTKSSNKNTYTYAIGRRRTAVCSVKLFAGKGDSTVNTLDVAKYFPSEHLKKLYLQPFAVTGTDNKYYFQSKIVGGGKNGQLDALFWLSPVLSRKLTLLPIYPCCATPVF